MKLSALEVFRSSSCDNCDADNVIAFGLGTADLGSVMTFCGPCYAATTKCRSCNTAQPQPPVDNRTLWETYAAYSGLCNACELEQIKADIKAHAEECKAHADECEPDWDGMARDYWESRNDGPVD